MKNVLFAPVWCALGALVLAQDQGMTSETHRKNVGKIVWARQRIKLDAQDATALASAFGASDPIYGRVYLPKSLVRLGQDAAQPNPASHYKVGVLVDGVDKGAVNERSFDDSAWTTVQINLTLTADDKTDSQNDGVPDRWFQIVKGLPDGKHRVQVEFLAGPAGAERKVAEGGFDLTKAGAARIAGRGLPEARMKDAALEAAMIAAVKAIGWKDTVPVKVVIIEPGWRMVRDAFGTITHREINTHVVSRKVADGSYHAGDLSFRQPHQGGQKFGSTEVYGIGTKSYVVDESELK